MKGDPRVLVALIGETRAAELTAEEFRPNLLEALGADLALCVKAGEPPNPFYEWARHVWTVDEPDDRASLYDEAVGGPGWRVLLEVEPDFLGGIDNRASPYVGNVAILYYHRRLLWQSLLRAGLLDAYDWIVLSRSDFRWPVPHPDTRLLSDRHIYVLDGEQYGGVCDRHFVIPRRYFEPVLHDLVNPIFTDAANLQRRIEHVRTRQEWSVVNIERFLALRLKDVGLWHRLRYLPYVPFTVRTQNGSTRWSVGVLDENLGYCVKYPTERERSEIAARYLSDQESWRAYLSPLRGAWRRWRLKRAYRRRGLYERAFTRRGAVARAVRRAERRVDAAAGRLGRHLRRAPGIPVVLDARMRRIEDRTPRRR